MRAQRPRSQVCSPAPTAFSVPMPRWRTPMEGDEVSAQLRVTRRRPYAGNGAVGDVSETPPLRVAISHAG